MVSADTYVAKNLHIIQIAAHTFPLQMAQTNGVDMKGGHGVTYETGGYDIDLAEDDDPAWAGVLETPSGVDADTAVADNQAVGVCPPLNEVWLRFVASGGAMVKGDYITVDGGTDGEFTATLAAGIAPRGRFEKTPALLNYHGDVAAMRILGALVLFGGVIALV